MSYLLIRRGFVSVGNVGWETVSAWTAGECRED